MLSDNARRMGPLRDKLQWVELWLKRRHLSDRLGRQVRAYYTEIWANHKGDLAPQLCSVLHGSQVATMQLLKLILQKSVHPQAYSSASL